MANSCDAIGREFSSSESPQVLFAEIILPTEHDLDMLIQSRPRPPSGTFRSAAKVTLCSTGKRAWAWMVLTETSV